MLGGSIPDLDCQSSVGILIELALSFFAFSKIFSIVACRNAIFDLGYLRLYNGRQQWIIA